MERKEVTSDEVTAAAVSLQNDGKQVTIDAVRDFLGAGSATAIHKHLSGWRASQAKAPEPPPVAIPDAIADALGSWVRQYAEEAGAANRDALAQSAGDLEALLAAGEQLEAERDDVQAQLASASAARDQALATAADRSEEIERLTAALRDARQVATDALVGKAKDRLAIDGKDSQLADLRSQLERNVAASAAESDARLAAEMELIGAVTARDSFDAEIRDLRAQLDAAKAQRKA